MDRILKPNLVQINNVGLGQKFSTSFPIGPAYRYIDIVVTLTTAAALTASVVTDFLDLHTLFANAKPFRTFLATEANEIYKKYGSLHAVAIGRSTGSGNTLAFRLTGTSPSAPIANDQTTCIFRIYFEEPWRKNWTAATQRKFFTKFMSADRTRSAVLNDFSLEALIPATANNLGATALSVLIYTGTDSSVGPMDAQGNPITNTLKWQRYPGLAYTAAGDIQLQNIVKYNKGKQLAILEEMNIFSQSAGDDVGRFQLWADNRQIFDATAMKAFDDLVRHGFNPVWNLDQFFYVADANDVITDGLVLSTPGGAYVDSLIATATLTAAAGGNKTLAIISQLYAPLD